MTDQNPQIIRFVEVLAQTSVPFADTYNQFSHIAVNPAAEHYNALRRANFTHYLHQIQTLRPKIMLVMEAPGYRGLRLTGVPVTSRKLLLNGVPQFGLFGTMNGYQDVPEPGFERIQGEQTATVVWGTLAALNQVALIWNAYPFHPHRLGQTLSNRAPRKPETDLGISFLRELMDIFACENIIAVGNVADASLNRMGVAHHKVRHPAQGGKNDFVRGMQRHLGS